MKHYELIISETNCTHAIDKSRIITVLGDIQFKKYSSPDEEIKIKIIKNLSCFDFKILKFRMLSPGSG